MRDRSPGPDGYNFHFIKAFWQDMKMDILHVLEDFHRNETWPKGGNSSFLTLIPKVNNPSSLNDYRPISLIGCMYKIVTKS